MSNGVPMAKPSSIKPAIIVLVIIFFGAIVTGDGFYWALLILFSLLLAMGLFIRKFNPKYNEQAPSTLGLELKYNYANILGIDEKNGKVFISTDGPRAFDKDEIRRVETDSMHEVKYNAWGHGFHKDKNCKLVIHVSDLDNPMHVIGFDKKEEMDKWFSRLSVFCNLT